jgi:hypothetical protein
MYRYLAPGGSVGKRDRGRTMAGMANDTAGMTSVATTYAWLLSKRFTTLDQEADLRKVLDERTTADLPRRDEYMELVVGSWRQVVEAAGR